MFAAVLTTPFALQHGLRKDYKQLIWMGGSHAFNAELSSHHSELFMLG
jgi:hypothetical protein